MTPRGKRHRVRWPRIILVSFVALVLVGAGTAYYVYRSAGTNLTAAAGNTGAFKGRINILLLGEGLIRNGSQDILNRLFAIYGWMVFCFISTELACFVQNVVDWAVGIILCFVQNTVELLPGV